MHGLPDPHHHLQAVISCLASLAWCDLETHLLSGSVVSFLLLLASMSSYNWNHGLLFIHLLMDIYSFIPQILINKSAKNILHKSCSGHMFSFFLSKSLAAELLSPRADVCLVYEKPPMCFPKCSKCHFVVPPPAWVGGSCPVSSSTFGIGSLFNSSHSGCEAVCYWDFMFISLIANDVKHLLGLEDIHMSSFVKYLFMALDPVSRLGYLSNTIMWPRMTSINDRPRVWRWSHEMTSLFKHTVWCSHNNDAYDTLLRMCPQC